MKEKDSLRRFLFPDLGLRGAWVSLDQSWQSIRQKHEYPALIEQQLGQAIAAIVLLTASLKFKGSMILQTQGDGALPMLVAQCSNERKIRGMARYEPTKLEAAQRYPVYGQGQLVLTIEQQQDEPYQGIVPMRNDDLAASLHTYFKQSEQLATHIGLFCNEKQAMGLLLQELPGRANDPDNWQRIEMLANTVTELEIMALPCAQILYRLFNEEVVRLFDAESVAFSCTCSVQKIENTLFNLGRATLEEILAEQQQIIVDCEFCNHQYRFDKVDVEKLLNRSDWQTQVSDTQH